MKSLLIIVMLSICTQASAMQLFDDEAPLDCTVSKSFTEINSFRLSAMTINSYRDLINNLTQEKFPKACHQDDVSITCEWDGEMRQVYNSIISTEDTMQLHSKKTNKIEIVYPGNITKTGKVSRSIDEISMVECIQLKY